jgi:lysophospholipase L1-like esterase
MITRRKRILFAVVAMSMSVIAVGATLLAVDVYLHARFARTGGFNVWGYRGPVASRKKPGEYRAVMLGGSTVYGYGVPWDQAIPPLLESNLRARGSRPFSVINLGYNNEGAYSFVPTLGDYRDLDYDLVILYEGYNDMIADPRAPNLSVFRHDSPVFRLTGYLPIFPIIFKEKAAVMTTGTAAALYIHADAKRTVFRPGLAARTAAGVLMATAEIGESLERQLGRVSAEPHRRIESATESGCKKPWAEYCRSVERAVQLALDMNKRVLVVTQPYLIPPNIRERLVSQQQELIGMLARRFPGDVRVKSLELGSTIPLSDPAISFDGMHLSSAGNQLVANALVEPVLQLASLQKADDR